MDINRVRTLLSKIKYIYVLVYMTCFSLFNFVYINHYLYSRTQFIYQGLILFGLMIIAFDFFTFGIMTRTKYSIFLILFYVVCTVSILLNLKYDPVANVKVVVWMLVQTFVFAAIDKRQSAEHHRSYYRWITEAVSLVWFVGCVWSLVMFCVGFSGKTTSGGRFKLGFVDGRLFGVFTDPNFAAVCVLFVIVMLICSLFMHKEPLPIRIYHVVVIVCDLLYVILSRSRTAEIGMIAAVMVVAFFVVKKIAEEKGVKAIKKFAVMCVSAVLCAVLTYSVHGVVNNVANRFYIAVNMEDTAPSDAIVKVERQDDGQNGDITNKRTGIWRDYLRVFSENVLFGTGPRNGLSYAQEHFPDSFISQRKSECHNGYFAVLVGTGLVGALVLLLYIILIAKKIIVYLWTQSGKRDANYVPILLLTVVLIIGAISAFPLHMLFLSNTVSDVMFWFVLGFVLNLVEESKEESDTLACKLTRIFRIKKFEAK